MSVDAISSQTSTNSTGVATNPQGLGKEDFLELLVAQISNQSPLNPMDSTAFVSQLAQFSSLEQLAQVNVRLDSLAVGQAGLLAGQAIDLVGKTITYYGSKASLPEGGEAQWRYETPQSAASVQAVIKDEDGHVVRTIELGGQTSGKHDLTWDGLDDHGNAFTPGAYELEIKAVDEKGDTVEAEIYAIGVVTAVVFENGYPEALIGEIRVQNNNILEVS